MSPKTKIVAASSGILASVLIYFAGTLEGWPLSFAKEPHRAAGVVMAQEALKLLQPGGKLYVITRDTANFDCPAPRVQSQAFLQTVAEAHTAVDSIETIGTDPLRPLQAPYGIYSDLMRRAPKGSVIVSFMGPPVLNDEQWSTVGELKVSNVVFCPGDIPAQSNLRSLLERQKVTLAVVDRPPSPEQNSTGGSERAVFNRFFAALTPAEPGPAPAPATPAKNP